MQLISLFSGIGGFELAAEWMGWDVIASCEINPFGQRVLKHYWPEAYHHDDIHTLNYEKLKTQSRWDSTRPTILTGGFPCQPYSMAGKRRGKEDDRHLWPEMLRVIREIRPDYIVGENVLGLVSWDGGLVFDEVHSDLEAEGYEVQAVVIPAAAVNAPHGRDRIWFCARLVKDTMHGGRIQRESFQERTEIYEQRHFGSGDTNRFCGGKMAEPTAHTDSTSPQQRDNSTEEGWSRQDKRTESLGGSLGGWPTTNTECIRLEQRTDRAEMGGRQSEMGREGSESANAAQTNGKVSDGTNTDSDGQQRSDCKYEKQPSEGGQYAQRDIEQIYSNKSIIEHSNCIRQEWWMHTDKSKITIRKQFGQRNARNIGMPNWDNFPTQSPICSRNDGLSTELDGITFSKWRNESIKAAGNAIVPQVAYSIFKAIIQCENKE